ncbi:MAG: hypothetical protein Q9222_000882 [Ikaeria aurantiellina]
MRDWRLLFALLSVFALAEALRKSEGQKALLSNIQTLTLRHGLKTSHRRVSPVPQLKCIGGNARELYEVDIIRCKNQGSDYEEENVQWTCTASLPAEFKLGSTDVICEGYESSSDPYVLKGSCGVEYRLVLTDLGEEKYGHRRQSGTYNDSIGDSAGTKFASTLFVLIFIGVLLWILYSAFLGGGNGLRDNHGGANPWGGGGGGGGWGFGWDSNDPPPPYSRHPPPPGHQAFGPGPLLELLEGISPGAEGRRNDQRAQDNGPWAIRITERGAHQDGQGLQVPLFHQQGIKALVLDQLADASSE